MLVHAVAKDHSKSAIGTEIGPKSNCGKQADVIEADEVDDLD